MDVDNPICDKHKKQLLYTSMPNENQPRGIFCEDCLIEEKEKNSNYRFIGIADYLKALEEEKLTAIKDATNNYQIISQIQNSLETQLDIDPSISRLQKSLNLQCLQIDFLNNSLNHLNTNMTNQSEIESMIQILDMQYVQFKNMFYTYYKQQHPLYDILNDSIKLFHQVTSKNQSQLDQEKQNLSLLQSNVIYQQEHRLVKDKIQAVCYINNYVALGKHTELLILQWSSLFQNFIIFQTLAEHRSSILKLINKKQLVISYSLDKLIIWQLSKQGMLQLIQQFQQCNFFLSDDRICVIKQSYHDNSLVEVLDFNMMIIYQKQFKKEIKIAASNKAFTLALFYCENQIQCLNPKNDWNLEYTKKEVMQLSNITFINEHWISFLHKEEIRIYQYKQKYLVFSHYIKTDAAILDNPNVFFVEKFNILICNNLRFIKTIQLGKDNFQVLSCQQISPVHTNQNKDTDRHQIVASYQESTNKFIIYQWKI